MVRKEVSKIDYHINKVVGVETTIEPFIAVDPNPEEMIPTIPPSLVVAKYSCKTRKSEMPLANRIL